MAAITEIDIYNMALARIGEKTIVSKTDNSAAVVCAFFYPHVIDQVLREFKWSFAITRQLLADIDDDYYSEYAYNYRLPSSPYCIRVIDVFSPDSGESYGNEPWQIEGRMLLSDLNPLGLKYVCRPSDPQDFDPLFVEAVVLCLASKIVMGIRNDATVEASMLQQYLYIINEARMIDGAVSKNYKNETKSWTD